MQQHIETLLYKAVVATDKHVASQSCHAAYHPLVAVAPRRVDINRLDEAVVLVYQRQTGVAFAQFQAQHPRPLVDHRLLQEPGLRRHTLARLETPVHVGAVRQILLVAAHHEKRGSEQVEPEVDILAVDRENHPLPILAESVGCLILDGRRLQQPATFHKKAVARLAVRIAELRAVAGHEVVRVGRDAEFHVQQVLEQHVEGVAYAVGQTRYVY